MAIMTPKQVAAAITVRPGPDGGHYYNGLLEIEEAARRIEPAFVRFDARTRMIFLGLLRKELGLACRVDLHAIRFELAA